MYRALRTRNACKTCALGMGGQRGGMTNELGRSPEVCKKSIQAMAADMQGRIREHFFDDFGLDRLAAFSPRELEAAGRLTEPLAAGPLDGNYRPVTWDAALDRIGQALGRSDPARSFFYASGRSSNEAGFLYQLLARAWGTNNVSNCSYYCHQASGVALSTVTGSGAGTAVLDDLDRCDLLFLIGCNPASNHPRLMRTIVDLRRRGGRVIVINPLREVGLERFRVPSDPRSLLFGSTIADLYVQPHAGGDAALLVAVARAVIERGDANAAFLREHTSGYEDFAAHLERLPWGLLVERSGVERAVIDRIAERYAASERTLFCWAMGVTHHEHGVENVHAIANLALLRGMAGRPGCGLLPLRGHSNVQGMGSMGVVPHLKPAAAARLAAHFGIRLPEAPGLDTLACLERADAGGMQVALCMGGNLYGASPDAANASRALARVDLVVYLSTALNTGHVRGRGRETIILPVLPRDEEPQATTQESMFSYVRLSDGGRPRHEGPRSEVQVIVDLARRLPSPASAAIDWEPLRDHRRVRAAIASVVPGYEAIGAIDRTRTEFHVAGRVFHEPRFATPDGRAAFHAVDTPPPPVADGELRLVTLRSEGQFNTVVYEDHDAYRGQERRDVILMSPRDMADRGLAADDRVAVRSAAGEMVNVVARPADIRAGNAAMYFPEANALVRASADPRSRTPGFKCTPIVVEPMASRTEVRPCPAAATSR
jgi:molybdopterin-dependent oxidoreductase alpha subunit